MRNLPVAPNVPGVEKRRGCSQHGACSLRPSCRRDLDRLVEILVAHRWIGPFNLRHRPVVLGKACQLARRVVRVGDVCDIIDLAELDSANLACRVWRCQRVGTAAGCHQVVPRINAHQQVGELQNVAIAHGCLKPKQPRLPRCRRNVGQTRPPFHSTIRGDLHVAQRPATGSILL